jgi:hypothetical protein
MSRGEFEYAPEKDFNGYPSWLVPCEWLFLNIDDYMVVESPSCFSIGEVAAMGGSSVSLGDTSLPNPDSSPRILDRSTP